MAMSKGVTLVELMLTIGILMVLFAIGTITWTNLDKDSEMDKIVSEMEIAVNTARVNCLNNIPTGVFFENSRYALFPGNTYDINNPQNEYFPISNIFEITNINLPNSSITFEKITGYIKNYSPPENFTLHQKNKNIQKTININRLGTITIN